MGYAPWYCAHAHICLSVVTEMSVMCGSNRSHCGYWKHLLIILTASGLCILLVSFTSYPFHPRVISHYDNTVGRKPLPPSYKWYTAITRMWRNGNFPDDYAIDVGEKDLILTDLLVNFTENLTLVRQNFTSRTQEVEIGSFPYLPKPTIINLRRGDFVNVMAPLTWITFVGLVMSMSAKTGGRQMVDVSSIRWQRDPLYSFYMENSDRCKIIDFTKSSSVYPAPNCSSHVNILTSQQPASPHHGDVSRYWKAFSAIYAHVIPNGVISNLGHVRAGSVYIVPNMCRHRIDTLLDEGRYNGFPLYNEVFTITQFWGKGYFHFNIETFPRIIPNLQFLKDNPAILIHVPNSRDPHTRDLIHMLGLEPRRLVDGGVRSRVVYLPQGSGCGKDSNPLTLQMLSNTYRDYMDRHFPPVTTEAIVLIERTRSRRLIQHQQVQS